MAQKCRSERESMECAALAGLCQAARNFDESRGVKFETYAQPRIVGAVKDGFRELLPKGFRRRTRDGGGLAILSLDAVSEDGETRLDSLASCELPVGWELEALDEVEAVARRLPAQYGEAVRLFFGHCDTATMKQVGGAMGVTESRVSQILTKSAEMLREEPSESA